MVVVYSKISLNKSFLNELGNLSQTSGSQAKNRIRDFPWSRAFLEKCIAVQLIKKTVVQYGLRAILSLDAILKQLTRDTLTNYFSKINLNNNLTFTPLSAKMSLHFVLIG